jgi:hypothetical protein
MPRPLKATNPYASWTALFGATLQRLRQDLSAQPVITQAELGRRVCLRVQGQCHRARTGTSGHGVCGGL